MHSLYDREAVRPMWEELERVGVRSLTTPEEVDAVLSQEQGTTLVVINSVCGCAAGGARPGVMLSLQHSVIPDASITVFAGVDRPAVERARSYMTGIAPSSPSIALFKDGKLVHVLERRHIEQMDANMVAENLKQAYNRFCTAPGPSIPAEEFARIAPYQQCGSMVPRL